MTDPTTHRAEVEREILGLMISDVAVRYELASRFTPDQFIALHHRPVFERMVAFCAVGKEFDSQVLAEEFFAEGRRELAYVCSDAYGRAPIGYYWTHYAERLEDLHRRHLLHVAGVWLAEAAEKCETAEVLAEADARLRAAAGEKHADGPTAIGDIAAECIADARERSKAGPIEALGARTGFALVDRCLLGFQPDKLYVLAARPRVGKSAMMATMALALARRGHPQAIISCEMNRSDQGYRILSMESGVAKNRIKCWSCLHADEIVKVEAARERLRKMPLDIRFVPKARPAEVRTWCRRLRGRMGLGCVWVDYVGIMRPDRGRQFRSREEEVAGISGELKALSGELHVAVIALAQLNREIEKRDGKEPRLSDLRDSGALEQDADAVLFVHREVDDKQSDTESKARLIVAKQRDGATGSFDFVFHPTRTEFMEPEEVESAF